MGSSSVPTLTSMARCPGTHPESLGEEAPHVGCEGAEAGGAGWLVRGKCRPDSGPLTSSHGTVAPFHT